MTTKTDKSGVRRKPRSRRVKAKKTARKGGVTVTRYSAAMKLRTTHGRAKRRRARVSTVPPVSRDEDAADVAVALDRLANPAGPNIPHAEMKKRLGL